MAFGEDELIFRINTGKNGIEITKSLVTEDGYAELVAILEIIRKEFYELIGIEQQLKLNDGELAAQHNKTLPEQIKFIKNTAKKIKSSLNGLNGLSQEFIKSVVQHWLASLILEQTNRPNVHFSQYTKEKRIDFVYKKNEKLVIKKLAIDNKTSIYQVLFQLSSISYSIINLLKQCNDKNVQNMLEITKQFEANKLYPYPTLSMFAQLELPEAEKRSFGKIIKKVIGKNEEL